jgi:hypothetical protein
MMIDLRHTRLTGVRESSLIVLAWVLVLIWMIFVIAPFDSTAAFLVDTAPSPSNVFSAGYWQTCGPNSMYVWDIEFVSKDKGRGKAVQDRRIIVIVRRDQNANCQPEASDPVVSKASVAVELHNSSDVLVGVKSGKTGNDGTYTTKQFKSLADSSYSIWVTGLSHDTYVWDQALDIANPAYVTVTH